MGCAAAGGLADEPVGLAFAAFPREPEFGEAEVVVGLVEYLYPPEESASTVSPPGVVMATRGGASSSAMMEKGSEP